MATPHIAGAMALLIKLGEKEFKRGLTESELYALLAKSQPFPSATKQVQKVMACLNYVSCIKNTKEINDKDQNQLSIQIPFPKSRATSLWLFLYTVFVYL